MKKFKINVQGYGCILLCLILCIMILLPIPVSAQEDRSKVVRVGWYEGTYNTTEADGQLRIPDGNMNMWREAGQN